MNRRFLTNQANCVSQAARALRFLLLLLPLLWLSIAAGVPHDHELRDLAPGVSEIAGSNVASGIVQSVVLSAGDSHAEHSHGVACLLCHWASAFGWAIPAIAVFIGFLIVALFYAPRAHYSSPAFGFSNSRAPPASPYY